MRPRKSVRWRGDGELRGGSNVGKGQMRAADYVLVPDLVNQNGKAGGKSIGGLLGGVVGGVAGAVLGGVSLKSKTADVVLTLTDVRSTEQISLQQGHAKKTDLGWVQAAAHSSAASRPAAPAATRNTEIGQVVTKAYLDAYIKMVEDVKAQTPDAKADNVQQAVSMSKAGILYEQANNKSPQVRELDAGAMLYPTGEKNGIWWQRPGRAGQRRLGAFDVLPAGEIDFPALIPSRCLVQGSGVSAAASQGASPYRSGQRSESGTGWLWLVTHPPLSRTGQGDVRRRAGRRCWNIDTR